MYFTSHPQMRVPAHAVNLHFHATAARVYPANTPPCRVCVRYTRHCIHCLDGKYVSNVRSFFSNIFISSFSRKFKNKIRVKFEALNIRTANRLCQGKLTPREHTRAKPVRKTQGHLRILPDENCKPAALGLCAQDLSVGLAVKPKFTD